MSDEVANRLDETKAQRFVRLAEKRMTKALQELRKVGNLAAPNYEYTQEQFGAIITALQKAVDDVSLRFGEPCSAENEAFSFVDWIPGADIDPEYEAMQADLIPVDDDIETIVHDDENP